MLFRKLGLNPQHSHTDHGDHQQQQQLSEQLLHADTEQFYNAAL